MSGEPASSVRFRAAREQDLPRLVELERAAHLHPWTEAQLHSELGHDYATLLCAEDGVEGGAMRIVGFLVYWLIHDELHVLDVVTAPEARRRGVARSLMAEGMGAARRAGASRVLLEVRRSNSPAIALYRALGFLQDTVRRGYYPDGEDAILMSLALGQRLV